MANSGRTVLVFLGACLAFAETAVGAIAALANPNGNLVAGFALLALGMVLLTLAYMYRINPGFLTLSGQGASELAILQTIAATRPELITPAFLLSLTSPNLAQGEANRVDEATGAPNEVKEATDLEEELERERRARASGTTEEPE